MKISIEMSFYLQTAQMQIQSISNKMLKIKILKIKHYISPKYDILPNIIFHGL